MGIFSVSSSAFGEKEPIPKKYTCDGENISPDLKIENAPEGTKSFVLIMDDPDTLVGLFTHWISWNIPAHKLEIKENEDPGVGHGKNDFGRYDYGGPCPPSGTHRYFFKVFALDTELYILENSTRKELEREMTGHILDESSLVGTYSRS